MRRRCAGSCSIQRGRPFAELAKPPKIVGTLRVPWFDAAQRRASPDTGPARLLSPTSAFAGTEPLKNGAVGGRVHALVVRPFFTFLLRPDVES